MLAVKYAEELNQFASEELPKEEYNISPVRRHAYKRSWCFRVSFLGTPNGKTNIAGISISGI